MNLQLMINYIKYMLTKNQNLGSEMKFFDQIYFSYISASQIDREY